MNQIEKDYGSDFIFTDIKLLIDFLLLKLHEEQKVDFKNQRIKNRETELFKTFKSEDEIIKKFYDKNQSLIQKLFFFDIKLSFECNYCTNKNIEYYVNFSLDFDIEQSNDNITISNLLETLNININCDKCNKSLKLYRKISNCPLYLIIFIRNEKNYKYNFDIEEEINIKNYVSNEIEKNIKYELIAIIKNSLITICKSPKENKWYKYDGSKDKFEININKLSRNFIPNLLIYKNKIK